MKILFATDKGGLDDLIAPIFGRAPTFTIVDTETNKVEVIQNQAAQAFSGAGIMAAQLAIDKGVDRVVAGNIGPNSSMVLMQAGIEIDLVSGMKVREYLEKYKERKSMDPELERRMLELQKQMIELQLKWIEKRLEELGHA